MEYDKNYGIDMLQEVTIVDTLGFVPVKDSIFKNSERYKNMMKVPHGQNNETFEMSAGVIDRSGYKVPVFEAKVEKKVVLYDQPADLLARENAQIGVEQVNGNSIRVGSMTEVSTSGNWPPIYDKKRE
jgi:hypothetical protein